MQWDKIKEQRFRIYKYRRFILLSDSFSLKKNFVFYV